MNVAWIAVAAFIGAVISALLGWVESDQPFEPRKFGASAIRGVIAAVIFAVSFSYINHLSPIDILYAFLGGAGVDVLAHRAAGIRR